MLETIAKKFFSHQKRPQHHKALQPRPLRNRSLILKVSIHARMKILPAKILDFGTSSRIAFLYYENAILTNSNGDFGEAATIRAFFCLHGWGGANRPVRFASPSE